MGAALSNYLVWDGAGFTPFLPEGERPLGRVVLLLWRRFESSRVCAYKKGLCLYQRGLSCCWGEPLSLDSRGVESGTREPSC
jgi:hypothetical protein